MRQNNRCFTTNLFVISFHISINIIVVVNSIINKWIHYFLTIISL